MKKFSKKVVADNGATVTIFALLMLALVMLIAGLVMDITRTQIVAVNMDNNAQQATQLAIRSQNSVGGLNEKAGEVAVKEYLRLRANNEGLRGTSCDSTYNYPQITVAFDTQRRTTGEAGMFKKTVSGTTTIPKWDARDFTKSKISTVRLTIKDVTPQWWGFFSTCKEIELTKSATAFVAQDGQE